MEEPQQEPGFSTYGLVTAERVLGKYAIVLPQAVLLQALKNPHSFYHQLLVIPSKNILNGIILQQAHDYQVYAQKLFIDYLLSGESSKPEETPGGTGRELMEEERLKLLQLADDFHQLELDQNQLIAESQAFLIQFTAQFREKSQEALQQCQNHLESVQPEKLEQALSDALVHADKTSFIQTFVESLQVSLDDTLKKNLHPILSQFQGFDQALQEYRERVQMMATQVTAFRLSFHQIILEAKTIMDSIPEYRPDLIQENINKESLYFDSSIGEERG
jgi:hypothetical protein